MSSIEEMVADFVPEVGRNVVVKVKQGDDVLGTPCEWRPAQIVRVWSKEGPKTVNLVLFVDGSNDAHLPHCAQGRLGAEMVKAPYAWLTSVVIGDGERQYLPRVPAAA